MEKDSHRLWITWERQRRNQSMAVWLSAQLCELHHSGGRFMRYIVLCFKTYRLIRDKKPEVIFFQNPSIVLSAFIALLKALRIIDCKIVGDFHNAGVYPPKFAFISRWVGRTSNLTIVSNSNLAAVVNNWGASAIAVPDPLPRIHGVARRSHSGAGERKFVFLFVCSWADDEPVANVVRAATLLKSKYPMFSVLITGRPKIEKYLTGIELPDNVTLTGFLPEGEFDGLLTAADVVIDLTTRADCMVCGAYEAVAAETPAILSDNQPTREYFNSGVQFTDNSVEDISRCMVDCYQNIEVLKSEIYSVKSEIQQREAQCLERLKSLLAR